MLTFVTLALRIHPFAATPFCLHRSLQICLAFGFSKVVFYDNPPCSGVYTAVSRRMSSASMLRMPCIEQRLRQGRTAFCLRSRFHGLQLQACAVNSCCFTLFSGGALRQDVHKLNVPVYCALFAVRVFIELAFTNSLRAVHCGTAAKFGLRRCAPALYIPLSNVCARAISRTRSRMIPMNKFSVLCRYRLTRFIRQKFQYFSITANKHSRCISRAGMKRKEQI